MRSTRTATPRRAGCASSPPAVALSCCPGVRPAASPAGIQQSTTLTHQPIQVMNETARQTARKKASLPDPHVHDLRHSTGMGLREAGLRENKISHIV